MFTATVKGFQRFPIVTADIEELCVAGLRDAAEAAAAVAQAGASIDLDLEIKPPVGTVDGFSAGIRSKREGKDGARLAPIFDEGTLGQKRGKLKGRRKDSWQVNRRGASYTAKRHPITPVEGHTAERFFPHARAAGRKALLARLDRGPV